MISRLTTKCKNLWTYILSASLFVFFLSLISLITHAEENDSKTPDEHIRTFVKLANEMKITKVEMYYFNWGALTYAPITKEKELTESYAVYRTTINAIYAVPLIDDIASTLSRVSYKKILPSKVDFRIGCIFYTKDRQVLRVFISRNTPAIHINGIPCRTSPAVVNALLPMLPVHAYQGMYNAMLTDWASPGYWKSMIETNMNNRDVPALGAK